MIKEELDERMQKVAVVIVEVEEDVLVVRLEQGS